jgi:hypothetical protein
VSAQLPFDLPYLAKQLEEASLLDRFQVWEDPRNTTMVLLHVLRAHHFDCAIKDALVFSSRDDAAPARGMAFARIIEFDGLIFDATGLIDPEDVRLMALNSAKPSMTSEFVWQKVPEAAIEVMAPTEEEFDVMTALFLRAIARYQCSQLEDGTAAPHARLTAAPRL